MGGAATKNVPINSKCPRITDNDVRLSTSDDRKASIYRQAIELPIVSAKGGCDTTHPLLRHAPDNGPQCTQPKGSGVRETHGAPRYSARLGPVFMFQPNSTKPDLFKNL